MKMDYFAVTFPIPYSNEGTYADPARYKCSRKRFIRKNTMTEIRDPCFWVYFVKRVWDMKFLLMPYMSLKYTSISARS
jgi:hypothetical protein